MEKNTAEKDSEGWKKFLKKHWNIAAILVVVTGLAFIGSVYIYLWFVGDAQASGMVPSTLDLWSMANAVSFILHLIFWELLLIGIPAGIVAVIGWWWWKKLPIEEKKEYHFFGKSSKTTNGGSGLSFLFFIAFCIKVYLDGNWNDAIATWTLDYVVNSMITILVWSLIIAGIPIAIGAIWWIHHEITKKPSEITT